eukprot:NODE_30263_length_423_cov_1.739865.p3 GENE.NODE_30263_length_423_cov_1.739865~~NODE_30263_length_423_cov_1.739865.p3  ORF type:complete len:52 (-),score=3.85 NODE_30263_length_423_cov_1.739865:66-221(-)
MVLAATAGVRKFKPSNREQARLASPEASNHSPELTKRIDSAGWLIERRRAN